jgi:putative transposase
MPIIVISKQDGLPETMIYILWASIIWLWIQFKRWFKGWFRLLRRKPRGWRRKADSAGWAENIKPGFSAEPKPSWVKKEVIRLKAFMPDDGCRKLAAVFNRLYRDEKQMTVGKTFVANVIRDHHYEIQVLRQKVKHRQPPILRKNIIWQVDLTGKPTQTKSRQSILGIIDHGCRACIRLCALPRKSSLRILINLLEAMEQFGKPKLIRTDNEAVFTSRLFKLVLWLLNIKHQQTELHCPWQNGRIERLFLTLKQKLHLLAFDHADSLNQFLHHFRFWYNFVRPHQHLNGKVPAEVWMKRTFNAKKSAWYEDETGLLRGYYLPPD